MNRTQMIPLALGALLMAACGQNYSDKPADGALAERNLTAMTSSAAGAKSATAVAPVAAASGLTQTADGGTQWSNISVELPANWQSEKPASSMRLAQYAIAATHGGEGVGLAVFPGPMGSVDDNINRWIGQFSQADGGSSEDVARRWNLTTEAGIEATFVDVAGTFNGGMGMGGGGPVADYRMLGAIVEKGGTILYLKLTGPAVEVADLQEPFEQVIRSMRAG